MVYFRQTVVSVSLSQQDNTNSDHITGVRHSHRKSTARGTMANTARSSISRLTACQICRSRRRHCHWAPPLVTACPLQGVHVRNCRGRHVSPRATCRSGRASQSCHSSASRHIPSHPVTSRHVTSRHIPSRHIPSHPVTSRHIPSRHIPSHPVTSHPVTSRHIPSRHITSHPVTSHPVTSRHIPSRHIPSHPVTSHHVTSRRHPVTSRHIPSRHITSHHVTSRHVTARVCWTDVNVTKARRGVGNRLLAWVTGEG